MDSNKKGASGKAPQNDTVNLPSDCSTVEKLTILETVGPLLTKVYRADGSVDSYGDAASFKVREKEVSDIVTLSAVLAELQDKPQRCQIHGKFVGKDKAEPAKVAGTYVRNNANFIDQPLHSFMLDIDKYKPAFGDPVEEPELCIDGYLRKILPEEFWDVSYHWQLSSSAGQPSNLDVLKAHVWFWLETPRKCSELYEWAKMIGPQVDKVVYRRAQIRYTAGPIFEEGRTDPVPVRSGLVRKGKDALQLSITEEMLAQARDQGAGEGGSDMKLVDPSEKDNLVGIFHKVFSPEQVLLEILEGQFEQISQRRFTWLDGGGTPEGVWVHDDGMHVGSSHNTWPVAGIMNLWDTVRVFKFGHLDKVEDEFEQLNIDSAPIQARPSNIAMIEWAGELDEIKAEIIAAQAERQSSLAELVGKISSATMAEVSGELCEQVRILKAKAVDPGTSATLDKAIQQRLKALSPNQAAPKIEEVRRMTRPVDQPAKAGLRILDAADQYANARAFMKAEFRDHNKQRLAVRANGSWFRFDGRCYSEIDEEAIRNLAWKFLDASMCRNEDGELVRFKPGRNEVSGVVDALRAVLASDIPSPPSWFPGLDGGDPMNMIVMQNGILDVEAGELFEHTPRFFTTNCLPFDFDPEARCPTWMRFIDDLWGSDQESKVALQELFGYSLTADTRQQKIFMLIGPKRSGKGTIARVLGELVGAMNRAAPTMSSLASPTGLECLVGKLLAIIGDARGGGKESQTVVERFLSISGEDTITFDRKYKSYWTGKLPTRFVILSNELLSLGDASGALVGRLVILKMSRSFYGHEDTTLTEKLLAELPGILNWALDGKRSLASRGRFVQPKSAVQLVADTADANNHVGKFVRENCELSDTGFNTDKAPVANRFSNLFDAYLQWCRGENISNPGNKSLFSQKLRAGFPDIGAVTRPRDEAGKQHDCYPGIRLRKDVIEAVANGLF